MAAGRIASGRAEPGPEFHSRGFFSHGRRIAGSANKWGPSSCRPRATCAGPGRLVNGSEENNEGRRRCCHLGTATGCSAAEQWPPAPALGPVGLGPVDATGLCWARPRAPNSRPVAVCSSCFGGGPVAPIAANPSIFIKGPRSAPPSDPLGAPIRGARRPLFAPAEFQPKGVGEGATGKVRPSPVAGPEALFVWPPPATCCSPAAPPKG